MKRILSFVLLLLVLAGTFTACFDQPEQTTENVVYDLDAAVKYFTNVQYPDWKTENATTPIDEILVSQVVVKLVTYKVTWKCDNSAISIVPNADGTLTLDVPKVAEDINYTLTATISDGNGNSKEVEYKLVVPANLSGEIVKPVPGTAYYIQIQQNNLKQVLFFNGEPESSSKTYRLAMTTNPGEAVEVSVEAVEGVEGAYRLYFMDGETKTYLVVKEQENEGSDKGSADPGYGKGTITWETETPVEYYTYNETFKTFVHTDAEGEDSYIMGTYNSYNTISVSNMSYFTEKNVDVSQFPVRFVTPDSVPGHTCKYVAEVTAPTCEADGYTTHTCSICGANYKDSTVTKLEHNWTATTPCTNGCGELLVTNEIKLTVNSLELAEGYTAGTATVDGVGFEWIQLGNYGDGLQVRDKDGKTTSLWNTTEFSAPIARIELVWTSTKDQSNTNPDCAIYSFGNAAGTYTYETKLSTESGVKEYTITPDAETYTFFKFEHDLKYTQYWESITIILVDGTVLTSN